MSFSPWMCLVLLVGISIGCQKDGAPPEPKESKSADAKTEETNRVTLSEKGMVSAAIIVVSARQEVFTPSVTVPATIVEDPQTVARIGARVPGRVLKINVAPGDLVVRDAALVEVDTVELHQVTTEYLTSLARTRQMEDTLRRARALTAERISATQDLRRAEADAAEARAQFHEAEEHLHFLGLLDQDIAQLRSGTSHGAALSVIRSPVDGVVSSVSVSLGQVLSGTELVATVGRVDRVWASLTIYESDLPRVRVGAKVVVQPIGNQSQEISGVLSVVSPLLDPEMRTAEGRVLLENKTGALRPGMSVIARIALPHGNDTALWLPPEAVQLHEGHNVVFVQVEERTFEARPVEVGESQAGRIPVREGIAESDRVVIHGGFALRSELERSELEEED